MKALIFVLSLFLGATVFAEGPCAQDRETYCKDVEHGGGAMFKCMKENEAKLSEDCKAHLADMKDMKMNCHEDAEKLCPGMKRKAMMKCMHKNHDKASEACQADWKEMKKARNK